MKSELKHELLKKICCNVLLCVPELLSVIYVKLLVPTHMNCTHGGTQVLHVNYHMKKREGEPVIGQCL